MIEDMSLRNLAPRTQEAYIRGCKKLAAFLRCSPETATGEDIRRFQLHLAEQGVSICTRNRMMTGVGFLFRATLRRPEIADQIEYIAEPQKIPVVLSVEEVRRLLDAAPGFKCRLLLSLAYGCGLRACEVVSLKVCDIDSAQMVIRIEQGKGLPLPQPLVSFSIINGNGYHSQDQPHRQHPSNRHRARCSWVPRLPRLRALQVCRRRMWLRSPTAGIRIFTAADVSRCSKGSGDCTLIQSLRRRWR